MYTRPLLYDSTTKNYPPWTSSLSRGRWEAGSVGVTRPLVNVTEAVALGVGNMQYGDWRDKQAGRRPARQHQLGRIDQRVWHNNLDEDVVKVGRVEGALRLTCRGGRCFFLKLGG
ncbi:Protein atp11 [Fusarium oxysporum f. sp. albedinis]|nr:Protein atp11 [Fusarium oxysporum f. sp. albedinis]